MNIHLRICELLIVAVVTRASELQMISETDVIQHFIQRTDYVYDIQEDIHRPGVLLVLSNCTLESVGINGSEHKSVTVFTDYEIRYIHPDFNDNKIYSHEAIRKIVDGLPDSVYSLWYHTFEGYHKCRSFLQRHTSQILVTGLSCVKQLDRADWSISPLVGECGPGKRNLYGDRDSADGPFKTAWFEDLQQIASVPGNSKKVIALECDKVRLLLMDDQLVVTLHAIRNKEIESYRLSDFAIISESDIYVGLSFHREGNSRSLLRRLNTTSDSFIDLPTSIDETYPFSTGTSEVSVLSLDKDILLVNVVMEKQNVIYAYNIRTGSIKALYNNNTYEKKGTVGAIGMVNSTVYVSDVSEEDTGYVYALHINNNCMLNDGTEEKYLLSSKVTLENGTSIICDIDPDSWDVDWRETNDSDSKGGLLAEGNSKEKNTSTTGTKVASPPLSKEKISDRDKIIIIIVIVSVVCLLLCSTVMFYIKRKRRSKVIHQRPLPPVTERPAADDDNYNNLFDELYEIPDESVHDYSSVGQQSLATSGASDVEGVAPSLSSQALSQIGLYVINPRVATAEGDAIRFQENVFMRVNGEDIDISGMPIIYVTNPTEA